MTKTEWTKRELAELLESEPDTKLKKKLLAMMEPEKSQLEQYWDHMQEVMDLLADTFGKKRTHILRDQGYSPRFGYQTKVGQYDLYFSASFDYWNQQHVEIVDTDKGCAVCAKIYIDRDNPAHSVELVRLVIDYLRGDHNA